MRHQMRCPKLPAQCPACSLPSSLLATGSTWGQDTQQAALELPSPHQPHSEPAPLGRTQSGSVSGFLLSIPWGSGKWDEPYHAKRIQREEEMLIFLWHDVFFYPQTNITHITLWGAGRKSLWGDRDQNICPTFPSHPTFLSLLP